jgi:hypothetical protein
MLVFAPTRYFAAKAHLRAHKWTLVSQPVSLMQQERIEAGLRTDATARYVISLAFKAPAEGPKRDQFECEIGWSRGDDDGCQIRPTDLNVRWAVRDGQNRLVARTDMGPRAGSLGKDHGSVFLGDFDAVSGQQYALEMTVNSASARLREYQPKLTVSIEPMLYKRAVVSAQLNAFAGLASLVLGAALVSISGILWWRKGNQDKANRVLP